MKNLHLDKCVDCLAIKQNRVGFWLTSQFRRKIVLELVHIDACYVDARSHFGGQYFVTIIDDFSIKL